MDAIFLAVLIIISLIVGVFVGIFLHKKQASTAFEAAQEESKRMILTARQESERISRDALKEAKEESRQRRRKFEEDSKNRRSEISRLESKVKQREQALEKKLEILERKETELESFKTKIKNDEVRYLRLIETTDKLQAEAKIKLENIAKLSSEQAKRELMRSIEDEAKRDAQKRLAELEKEHREIADSQAKSLISHAVQKLAGDYVNESTVSVVTLPSDDMKGRIIGREGRNIRMIESLTGVDLIIDDTPEAIVLSSFNPIRREIAKLAMEKLLEDGRIHPARIEETVKKIEADFQTIIEEVGEQACYELGVTDLHPEIVRKLGSMKYRSTGQQSVLKHSMEVAMISGMMAAEMGVSVAKAKRAGLLHDIGKMVDQEIEGHHSQLGADFCTKFGIADDIVEAILHHHDEDVTHFSPLSLIVHAANILSSNRPGARKEQLEAAVKRLVAMEEVVKRFASVDQAFVMQAGKEIRVLVHPSGVNDEEVVQLSHEIASSIRKELTFPGQIRVTLSRESRHSEIAQ